MLKTSLKISWKLLMFLFLVSLILFVVAGEPSDNPFLFMKSTVYLMCGVIFILIFTYFKRMNIESILRVNYVKPERMYYYILVPTLLISSLLYFLGSLGSDLIFNYEYFENYGLFILALLVLFFLIKTVIRYFKYIETIMISFLFFFYVIPTYTPTLLTVVEVSSINEFIKDLIGNMFYTYNPFMITNPKYLMIDNIWQILFYLVLLIILSIVLKEKYE